MIRVSELKSLHWWSKKSELHTVLQVKHYGVTNKSFGRGSGGNFFLKVSAQPPEAKKRTKKKEQGYKATKLPKVPVHA